MRQISIDKILKAKVLSPFVNLVFRPEGENAIAKNVTKWPQKFLRSFSWSWGRQNLKVEIDLFDISDFRLEQTFIEVANDLKNPTQVKLTVRWGWLIHDGSSNQNGAVRQISSQEHEIVISDIEYVYDNGAVGWKLIGFSQGTYLSTVNLTPKNRTGSLKNAITAFGKDLNIQVQFSPPSLDFKSEAKVPKKWQGNYKTFRQFLDRVLSDNLSVNGKRMIALPGQGNRIVIKEQDLQDDQGDFLFGNSIPLQVNGPIKDRPSIVKSFSPSVFRGAPLALIPNVSVTSRKERSVSKTTFQTDRDKKIVGKPETGDEGAVGDAHKAKDIKDNKNVVNTTYLNTEFSIKASMSIIGDPTLDQYDKLFGKTVQVFVNRPWRVEVDSGSSENMAGGFGTNMANTFLAWRRGNGTDNITNDKFNGTYKVLSLSHVITNGDYTIDLDLIKIPRSKITPTALNKDDESQTVENGA